MSSKFSPRIPSRIATSISPRKRCFRKRGDWAACGQSEFFSAKSAQIAVLGKISARYFLSGRETVLIPFRAIKRRYCLGLFAVQGMTCLYDDDSITDAITRKGIIAIRNRAFFRGRIFFADILGFCVF
jgi:hypothetical protein